METKAAYFCQAEFATISQPLTRVPVIWGLIGCCSRRNWERFHALPDVRDLLVCSADFSYLMVFTAFRFSAVCSELEVADARMPMCGMHLRLFRKLGSSLGHWVPVEHCSAKLCRRMQALEWLVESVKLQAGPRRTPWLPGLTFSALRRVENPAAATRRAHSLVCCR